MIPVTLVFSGIGAPLAGYVRDSTGSYISIWLVGAGLLVMAGVGLALTPPPLRLPASVPFRGASLGNEDR